MVSLLDQRIVRGSVGILAPAAPSGSITVWGSLTLLFQSRKDTYDVSFGICLNVSSAPTRLHITQYVLYRTGSRPVVRSYVLQNKSLFR